MINAEYFENKDREILKLKIQISKFKEYDKKRKEYYSDVLKKLGEAESYIQELESGTEVGKLKKKIKNLNIENKNLRSKITLSNHPELLEYNDVSDVDLKLYITKLKKENKSLKDTVADLIYKLNHVQTS